MFKKLPVAVLFVMFTQFAIADPIVTDSTSRSTTDSTSNSTTTVKSPPPTAVAPAITIINSDVCAVAASGAIQTQILGTEKTEALSEVRTWIVGVECNLADRHHGPKSDIWVIPKFEFNFD